MDKRKDARTDGRTWATLNALPHSTNSGGIKIRKAFSKLYHRHSELVVKYNIGLKTLLQRGISEPIFYGDLVYKFKQIVENLILVINFKKIIKRYICADRYLR